MQPGGGPGGGDADIPTLPEWGLILLGSVLLLQMARAQSRGRQSSRTLRSAWPLGLLALLTALALWFAASPALANETLQFDARGNINGRTVDGQTSTYRYDRIDRLNQETGVATQSIGLDANANRTSDGAATYTVLANGNRITTRNVVSLIYDPAGNLLGDQTTLGGATVNRTFTYTLAGQLRTVSINGTLRATYTYNHLSQRTRKVLASPAAGTPGTTLYRYDTQGRMVEEIAGTAATATGISVSAGQSLVTYVWKDDVPSAVIYGPSTPANPNNSQERIIYLHTDHLDTPRKATDAQARVVWSWTSDAFGSTAAIEDVDANGSPTSINLRFPGQYFDAESGLHYNWNRYYDPRSGRYTQSDPIGIDGGINTYAYVGGNPVSFVDSTGLIKSDDAAIASAIARGDVRQLTTLLESGALNPAQAQIAQQGIHSINVFGRTISSTSQLAQALGRTNREVRAAVERCKQQGLPRNGPVRNPDVRIDPRTGEVFPELGGGRIGDSIGNIFDFLQRP